MVIEHALSMKTIDETLTGIVSKVTYHNQTTGWSVLRVRPLNAPQQQQETVTVHQTKVFAGATMEFIGAWTIDGKYGRQFKANKAVEKKPATTASIEKYLGSGLISTQEAIKLSKALKAKLKIIYIVDETMFNNIDVHLDVDALWNGLKDEGRDVLNKLSDEYSSVSLIIRNFAETINLF